MQPASPPSPYQPVPTNERKEFRNMLHNIMQIETSPNNATSIKNKNKLMSSGSASPSPLPYNKSQVWIKITIIQLTQLS